MITTIRVTTETAAGTTVQHATVMTGKLDAIKARIRANAPAGATVLIETV